MDQHSAGGVKVTYIETQFVTSDAAGFKDLVQRLTGNSAVVAAPEPPHRPRPCCAAAGRPQGQRTYATPTTVAPPVGRAPPCQMGELIDVDMADFSDLLFHVGARRGPHNGGYTEFPY